jgi:benzoyl-CoA reductase/2-hydroxyglutaryl-CoA dehydratase subunit BcrC/BadD/HgdB
MRYVASLLEQRHGISVFVMNVPSTWQTETSRGLYLAELQRLSRFLVSCGGNSPSPAQLGRVMVQFDGARTELRQSRCRLSAKEFAAALIGIREGLGHRAQAWPRPETERRRTDIPGQPDGLERPSCAEELSAAATPLALAGGPLPESDYELFDWVQQAGGRIVLDATEWGERTLPRPLDAERTRRDPLGELADAYFGAIPDVFRRPNDPLYEYLGRELSRRQVRGLIVRRYLWCDLWHAEVAHLKAWSPVPVLDLDAAGNEGSAEGRTRGRVEAFLEMLR